MKTRIHTVALAVTAAALVAAPLAIAAPAAAAPAPNTAKVLFFSNDSYSDPDGEDPTQIAALEEGGATVTVFDGGDGTGAAWSAALSGQDFLVIPESESIFDSPVLDDDAEDVLFAFVDDGGQIILPTLYQPELLSFLTGLDYTAVWSTSHERDPGLLQVDNPAFPAEVLYSDSTDVVDDLGTWGPDLLDPLTPLYLAEDGLSLYAGQWTVGAGTITVLAYDWYPGDEPEDIAGRATWNQLLQAIVYVPGPQLAATGLEVSPVAFAALGVLVLGSGALLLARRTAKA